MNATRPLLAATLALAAAITLASCSSSESSSHSSGMDHGSSTAAAAPSPSAAADFTEQDLAFAQRMRPHHEQAVEMADMMLTKDGVSSDIRDLASQIKAAQKPEIDQLDEWISAWGGGESMSGMDHGMDGMMSDHDMTSLQGSTGADAEALFLRQMIQHHEGAVEMAQTEVENGRNPDAIDMANAIVSTQTVEIDTMQRLLAGR